MSEVKKCKNRNCNNEIIGNKKYCCSRCQYWEKQMLKDDEKGMMPKNKRNKEYFWMYIGSSYGKGQGKRSGGMVTGALTGIPIPNFSIAEVNQINLKKHFEQPLVFIAELGDGSRITKEQYEKTILNN